MKDLPFFFENSTYYYNALGHILRVCIYGPDARFIAPASEVFYSYLEKLVGSEGAHIIRNTSIKRLCLKLRREYEEIEKYFQKALELNFYPFSLRIIFIRT